MYCGQCGKRVLDDMLFCPFCGSPIVIPDQDEPKTTGVSGAEMEKEAVQSAEQNEADEAPAVEEAPTAEDSGEGVEEAAPEVPAEVAEKAEAEIPIEVPAEDAEPKPPRWEDIAFPIDEAEQAAPAAPAAEAISRNAEEADDGKSSWPADEAEDDEPVWPSDEPEPEDEPFAPLEIGRAEMPVEDDAGIAPPEPRRDETQRRTSPRRRGLVGGGRSVTQTFIPVRDVNPNDMFMDSAHPAARDEYDPYDDDGPDGEFDREFAFEEPEPEGFAQRHIRGIVGVALMFALLAVFLILALLPAGQRMLASANLAWNAGVYNDLGYEAYEAGDFLRAAGCFERALARDGDNYDYAHSAMVAYYEGGETGSALAMLKRCIDMDPDNPEPYAELLILYPDAAARPWDVQQLLRQGYQRTGEEALNVAGE